MPASYSKSVIMPSIALLLILGVNAMASLVVTAASPAGRRSNIRALPPTDHIIDEYTPHSRQHWGRMKPSHQQQQQQQQQQQDTEQQTDSTPLLSQSQSPQWPPEAYWNQIRLDFGSNFGTGHGGAAKYSHSTSHPNFSYEWTRWSSLSFHALEAIIGGNNTNMFPYYRASEDHYFDQFENHQKQYDSRVDWRSEPLWSFPTPVHVYDKKWPRPQTEVSYLRTIVRLNHVLLDLSHRKLEEAMTLWDYDASPMTVKWDLVYLIESVNDQSYDIWERCLGVHFSTLMIARRAVMIGAEVAFVLGDDDFGIALLRTAIALSDTIKSNFLDGQGDVIRPTKNPVCGQTKQSTKDDTNTNTNADPVVPAQYDIQVLLALLHGKIDAAVYSGVINITKQIYYERCTSSLLSSSSSPLSSSNEENCTFLSNIVTAWATKADFYEHLISPRPYHFDALYTLHLLDEHSHSTWPFIATKTQSNGFTLNALGRFVGDNWTGVNNDSPTNNPWSLSSFIASYVLNSAGQYLQQLPTGYPKQLFRDVVFKGTHRTFWAWIAQLTLDRGYATGSAKTTLEKVRDNFAQSSQTQTLSRDQYNNIFKPMARTLFDLADDAMMIPGFFFGYGVAPNVVMSEQIDGKTGGAVGGVSMTPALVTAIVAHRQREVRAQAWGF